MPPVEPTLCLPRTASAATISGVRTRNSSKRDNLIGGAMRIAEASAADLESVLFVERLAFGENEVAELGGALIEHGIQRLDERGIEMVFVLGHPGHYPRHAFEPAIRLGLMAQYPISPEAAWMVRALQPAVIGQVRGTVVAADAMNRPEYWRE
jgi:putative acetyltransferase